MRENKLSDVLVFLAAMICQAKAATGPRRREPSASPAYGKRVLSFPGNYG